MDNPTENYESLHNDGKMMKRPFSLTCEWCNGFLPNNQVAVNRHYKINHLLFGRIRRHTTMHLTCYDLAREYCENHSHTFHRYRMKPLEALQTKGD